MTFSLHDSIAPNGALGHTDPHVNYSEERDEKLVVEEFHILRDKLQIPTLKGLLERPRIDALLVKSLDQFPATLISGRSGTGKTVVAATFAAGRQNVSWYSVESTDVDWPVFSRYFSASLSETFFGSANGSASKSDLSNKEISQTEIARFLIDRFSRDIGPSPSGSLIVLDDIHNIFDAPWFEDFFNLLLYSLPPETHLLLLLCRSKPPGPLWRLRSKQMLNVLDEKVIAFNGAETEELFQGLGLPGSMAQMAQQECFGRVSKLLQFAGHPAVLRTK